MPKISLGGSLTPYPAPSERGTLVEAGPYAAVRHPIYAGGILFFAGFGLFSSPLALGLAGALAVLWALKATVEERLLRERYPGYEAYAARVPHRLVPGVF